jgi:hypothetical protein
LRIKTSLSITSSALLLAALAGSAWAQDEGDPCGGGEGDPCGGDPVEGEPVGESMADDADASAAPGAKPPMILAKGKLKVNVPIGINLGADAVAKPIALAPDVWYGVAPKLQVGLVHSNMGLTGFWFQGLGGGVCVTGTEGNCAKLYNGPVGVLAHYLVMEGGIDLAADAGLVISTLDPMALSMKVGVRGRWMSGKIAVHFSPGVGVGVTERDTNGDEIFVPVSVGYMVSDKLAAGVQTGIFGPLDGLGDAFAIPLGLGAKFNVNESISVAGSFNFWNIAGKNSSADFRDLTVSVGWHN